MSVARRANSPRRSGETGGRPTDHWVGVSHEVQRFVDRLEERIDGFDYELEFSQFEHVEQIRRLQALLGEKDQQIGRLQQELEFAKARDLAVRRAAVLVTPAVEGRLSQ